jgi:hypothetical protein
MLNNADSILERIQTEEGRERLNWEMAMKNE